jgi:chemotaxis methyl-accepting protein methylase
MVEKTPADPEFEALLRYIQESRGLDFRGYKRTSLRRRITLRMEAVGVEDFSAYQAHLEVHPGEFEDLLNTVLINVTSFFRDDEAWSVLRDRVIPRSWPTPRTSGTSGCGASAAPRARSPIRWPCCSPRPWAWPNSAAG